MENRQRAVGVEAQACSGRTVPAKTVSAALESTSPLASESFRSVPRALLVILRVYLGVILLITNLGKLTRDNPFSTEMLSLLRGVATRRASVPLPPLPATRGHPALYLIQLSRDDRRSGRRAFASHWNDDARWLCRRHFSVPELHVGEGPHVLVAGQ
jgi:hypothetical protein